MIIILNLRTLILNDTLYMWMHSFIPEGRRRLDHMLVTFTTTYAISAYHH